MLKRFFDIVVSLIGLLAVGPVLIFLMTWVKVDSRGPVFFRQTRVGKGARNFSIYKLRTMVADAEKLGGYSTKIGDARITKAGAFLRRTSLDELPQLLNVLIGDMSLVGPRPDTPMQEENYSQEDWRRRTSVRPGITGLAQARLRSAATGAERLSLDLEYVDRPTLSHDLAILCETARNLFLRKAY